MHDFWNVIGLEGHDVIQLPNEPDIGDELDLYEYYWAGGPTLYTVEDLNEDTKTLTLKETTL